MIRPGQIVMYQDKDKRAHFGRVVHVGTTWLTLTDQPGTKNFWKVRLDSVKPWPPIRDGSAPTRRVKRGAA
jgi:hypothetical protein